VLQNVHDSSVMPLWKGMWALRAVVCALRAVLGWTTVRENSLQPVCFRTAVRKKCVAFPLSKTTEGREQFKFLVRAHGRGVA